MWHVGLVIELRQYVSGPVPVTFVSVNELWWLEFSTYVEF